MMEVLNLTEMIRDDPNVVLFQVTESPDVPDQHTLRVEVPTEGMLPPILRARIDGRTAFTMYPRNLPDPILTGQASDWTTFAAEQPTPLTGYSDAAEAVLAAILEANEHDEIGPEQDDPGFLAYMGIAEDAEHMAREVRTGLGVPDPIECLDSSRHGPQPNANGDAFPEILRQTFSEEMRRQLAIDMMQPMRERLARGRDLVAVMPVQQLPDDLLPRYVTTGPEYVGRFPHRIEMNIDGTPHTPDEQGWLAGRRSGMSVSAAIMAAVSGQIESISMGARVPRGVLGGEPAFQPASAMGPDEPSRNPVYFAAREHFGTGVINPRGLAQLGLTGGGEHPGVFQTEHLGTFTDPHPAHISHPEDWAGRPRHIDPSHVNNPADRQAVVGQRITVPEFVSIEANPRVQLGDIRTRRFDMLERSKRKALPYPMDTWVMADGLMMQVELATQTWLKCQIWDPQRKRFVGDIEINITESTIKAIPAPPERTAWDWLLDD